MSGYTLLFGDISKEELEKVLKHQQQRQETIDQFQKSNAEKLNAEKENA